MATNPYFNKNYSSQSEQDLYDDLMEESIKIHGIDVSYLPRDIQKIDSLFKAVDKDSLKLFAEMMRGKYRS